MKDEGHLGSSSERSDVPAFLIGYPTTSNLSLALASNERQTHPARQFDAWPHERGYTPGTVGLVLKYVLPATGTHLDEEESRGIVSNAP